MKVYVCVPPQKLVMNYMFLDAASMENVTMLDAPWGLDNGLMRFGYKVHHSKKLNSIVKLPFRDKWTKLKRSTLLKQEGILSEDCVVIFLNPTTVYFTEALRDRLRSNPRCRLVLCLLDPASGANAQDAFTKLDWFDEIYSFDHGDCEKYGFRYFFQCYSILKAQHKSGINNSLFFVGWGSKQGRLNELRTIARKCREKRISYYFHVVRGRGQSKRYPEFDTQKKPMRYLDVLDHVMDASCLLDIVQNGQSGASLKYIEAVCYNKKLLTNNPDIVNFPFYDSRYMKIYSDAHSLDLDWIAQNDDMPDYGYAGEFSPVRLINTIVESCGEERKQI